MSTILATPEEKISPEPANPDEFTRGAANRFRDAAAAIRKGGQRSSKVVEDIAEVAAHRLDDAGTYIEGHDLNHTVVQSRRLVRRYPTRWLAIAVGVGFLAALAIQRMTATQEKSNNRE